MTKIDWSAASVKELVDMDWSGLKHAKPVTLNFGYVSDDDSSTKPVTLNLGYISDDGSSTDGRYRDAILKELARLHRIANVGESLDIDVRIDELLSILEDVGGDE